MKLPLTALLTTCLFANAASASPIQYTPSNPSFGGNPLNGSFLLQEATAQRPPQKNTSSANALSSTQSFAKQITNSVLSRVSTEIANQIYGENARDSGTFMIGDSKIEFHTVGNNVVLTVSDSTGSTTITIPKPSA